MTTHTLPERLLVCIVVATIALAPLVGGAAALGAGGAAGPVPDGGGADADLDRSTAVAQTDSAGELALNVTNETDDTVTVTLETTATDVGGYQAHLTFDPDATAVRSVSGGDGDFDVPPTVNVDNENGSVQFNAVARSAPDGGVDAPTMARIVFDAPDASTGVSFVAADSLLSTSDAEAVTDLARNGATIGDGGDGSDGTGGAPGGGDGGSGGDGSDGTGGAPGGGGGDGSDGTGGAPGGGGGDGSDGTGAASPTVEAEVTPTDAGASLSASDVDAGSTVEADFGGAVGDGAVTIDRLSIETDAAVGSLTVEARSVSVADLPEDAPEAPGSDAPSYVEFATAADGTVAGATISFSADADALGVAPEDVTMYHLVDGDWTALETTNEGDGTYIAETSGFSYFAVSGIDAADLNRDDAANASGSDPGADGDGGGSGDAGSTDGEGGTPPSGEGDGGAPILEEQSPGLGILTALIAAIGAALLARRR